MVKEFGIGCLVILVAVGLLLGAVFLTIIGTLNKENALRAQILAHQKGVELKFDTMKKIITQNSQLPAAAKKDLLALLPEIVEGRSGGNIFKSVQENYPELTINLYKSLGRSIEGQRESLLVEQKELLDVSREHNQLLGSVPGGFICQMFGRKPIEIHTISSTEAKEAIRTGVEDDVDLNLDGNK